MNAPYEIMFFVYTTLVPPDLHSFPTRRSSDLGGGHRHEIHAHPYSQPDGGKRAEFLFRGADRKSTRLNSSHMSISYAVFCLKKNTLRTSSPNRPRTFCSPGLIRATLPPSPPSSTP